VVAGLSGFGAKHSASMVTVLTPSDLRPLCRIVLSFRAVSNQVISIKKFLKGTNLSLSCNLDEVQIDLSVVIDAFLITDRIPPGPER
jgi:hypothetical protein